MSLAISSLRPFLDSARDANSIARLRGIEGSAASAWFDGLQSLVAAPFTFTKRVKRPPTDPVNALLSLGYTWVCNRVAGRIQAAGLELNLGALHEYRFGRPSLACDLMEPLRVPAVDRWVIGLLARAELVPEHFTTAHGSHRRHRADDASRPPDHGGGVRLVREVFSKVLASWERHWVDGEFSRTLDLAVQELTDMIRNRGRQRTDETAVEGQANSELSE